MKSAMKNHLLKMILGIGLILFWLSPSKGFSWGMMGGGISDGLGMHISIGWPKIEAGVHIPIGTMMEIVPKFDLYYGWNVYVKAKDYFGKNFSTAAVPVVGDRIGAEFKIRLLNKLRHALSFDIDFALLLQYYNISATSFSLGIQLGTPAIKYSFKVNDKVIIGAAFKIPLLFVVYNEDVDGLFAANFPILFGFIGEFYVTKSTAFHLLFEMGPDIWKFKGASTFAGFALNFLFGFNFGI